MAVRIEESMNFSFEFLSPFDVDIEESAVGVAMINGTLLAEGVSKNGNLYTLDEMDNIAQTAEGKNIYVGTMTKPDPNTGLMVKNAHANVDENRVGKIIKSWVDIIARKVKFIAELVNTAKFPNIIEEVKKGWGISIGGKGLASFMKYLGKTVTKISNLEINHIQLLPPEVIRGQDEAQVENKEAKAVEETMIFYEVLKPKLNAEVKLGGGVGKVEVSIRDEG